jgi:hypothetical protein
MQSFSKKILIVLFSVLLVPAASALGSSDVPAEDVPDTITVHGQV